MKKITEIKKKNTLGIFSNALKITTDDQASYKFSSFSNRNVAYKSMVALWKNVSQYAKDVVDEDEEGSNEQDSELDEEQKNSAGKPTLRSSQRLVLDQPSGAVGKSMIDETPSELDIDMQDPSASILNPSCKMEKLEEDQVNQLDKVLDLNVLNENNQQADKVTLALKSENFVVAIANGFFVVISQILNYSELTWDCLNLAR